MTMVTGPRNAATPPAARIEMPFSVRYSRSMVERPPADQMAYPMPPKIPRKMRYFSQSIFVVRRRGSWTKRTSSCRPPDGQSHPHQSRPTTSELVKRRAKTTRPPVMTPIPAASVMIGQEM